MRPRQIHHPVGSAALAFLLAAVPSCGSETKYDWKNREIAWRYGPTTGTARSEHLTATGTKGAGAITEGWQCRLSDGKRLTVEPYHLAQSHALFGKVAMVVGLFDKEGKQLESLRSAAITAQDATFSFEIAEAVAQLLYDVVIWFREA
ncbi:MAG: hypothetical protein ABIP94_23080 [Planctomycetota bacterium]